MEWNISQVRKRSWRIAFGKAAKAWFSLVFVAFLFSFIGASNGSQTTFIDSIDQLIGANDPILPGNVDMLKEYIVQAPVVRRLPFITSDLAVAMIDSASKGATWMLKLLGANIAYFQRNQGEAATILLISAVLAAFVKFFILNVVIVGRNRFVMENRFSKEVPLRRIAAPFHRKTLGNVVKVMFLYNLSISLWSLTIVGGIYKRYQYWAVPYLIAENPEITWREAKVLSSKMTKGCKGRIFLTQLSCLHIWLLKLIPLVGLLVAVPMEMALNAEFYFILRNSGIQDSPLFTEPAFSALPYVEQPAEPQYALSDLSLIRLSVSDHGSRYTVANYILMFFLFCLIGWLWECGLHLFREHVFVNRGTLYGPWIPIYGVGGTAMVLLLDRYRNNKWKLLVSEVLLCAVLEYLSSFLLDYMFNASYWDYKTMLLNLNGRICLAGLAAFALGGFAAIYGVAPALAAFSARFSKRKQMAACVLLCAAFVLDLVCCLIFGFNSGAGVGGQL